MFLGTHKKQVEGSTPLAGLKGSQEHNASCLPASEALWVAWEHTRSLRSFPGHGDSPDRATATQHRLVAPRMLPCTCSSPALCNSSQTQDFTMPPGFSPALAQDLQEGLCWSWMGTLTEPKLLCSWGQDVCLRGSGRTRGNMARSHGTPRGTSDLLLGPVSAGCSKISRGRYGCALGTRESFS